MNFVNRAMGGLFDVVMAPIELLGVEWALILVSGIAGIGGLIVFKFISWQKGIKGVKDKIKGNLIAIRIYQDDLLLVAVSVGKILLRNFQYLGLNFGPILPLFAPFVLVLAQLVVRYGFAPIPVQEPGVVLLPGQATQIEVQLAEGRCAGRILDAPDGTGGFGYDPVFWSEMERCSMARVPEARKNEISHRALAFAALGKAIAAALA